MNELTCQEMIQAVVEDIPSAYFCGEPATHRVLASMFLRSDLRCYRHTLGLAAEPLPLWFPVVTLEHRVVALERIVEDLTYATARLKRARLILYHDVDMLMDAHPELNR